MNASATRKLNSWATTSDGHATNDSETVATTHTRAIHDKKIEPDRTNAARQSDNNGETGRKQKREREPEQNR